MKVMKNIIFDLELNNKRQR